MALFQYSAMTQTGEFINGEMEARSREGVLDEIVRLGHVPVEVVASEKSEASNKSNFNLAFNRRLRGTQVTLFTRELAMLLTAGLTLEQSLAQLERNAGTQAVQQTVRKLRASIDSGKQFHEALDDLGGGFSAVYIALVRVAEATGTLPHTLERLSELRDKQQKLRADLLSTLLYPALLVITAIGAISLIMLYVVPKFRRMLEGNALQVSDSAHNLLAVSDWMSTNGWQLMLGLVLVGFLLKFSLAWGPINGWWSKGLVNIPLIGELLRQYIGARFCRTFGILLDNGVDVQTALSLTGNTMSNREAKSVITQSCESLRMGRSFTEPLARSSHFHPLIASMLSIAEEGDNLGTTAGYLAGYFEAKLELGLKRLFTIIEPLIIIGVSIAIASIIIIMMNAVLGLNALVL